MLTFLSLISLSSAATITIAERNKTSPFVIIFHEDPSRSISHASYILKNYVNRICGVNLAIKSDSDVSERPEHCILVGDTKFTDALLPNINEIKSNLTCDDSFHLEIKGSVLIIVGGRRGCHYGIFELLEKYCGVYWFGKNNYLVPSLDKVEFTFEVDHQNPFSTMRDCYSGGISTQEIRMFNRNNYINHIPDNWGGALSPFEYATTHTFFQFISPKEYFETHPEYFAFYDGNRGTRGQLCLSNPDVLEIIINKSLIAVEKLESLGTRFLSVSMQDGGHFCNCSECRSLNEIYSGNPAIPSGSLIWFVNQVADAVKSQFPEKNVFIDTIAYHESEPPPNNIVARENVMVRLCPIGIDHIKSINESDNPANKNLMTTLIGWHKVTNNLHVWHYTAGDYEMTGPYANFRSVIQNVFVYIDNGVKGFFFLGGAETTDLYEMKNWIVSKLLWNPNQDINLLIKTFTDNFYGPVAGPFMREFVDGYHDIAIRDNRQSYIYMNLRTIDWYDESKYFLNYLPRMEKMVEQVKSNEYHYHNMLKSSIPCIYMAYFRHLISTKNNIIARYEWNLEIQAVQVSNQLSVAVETAKNLYDRIFMSPKTRLGTNQKHSEYIVIDILKEGHGSFITVLRNENNYSFGFANGHQAIIGSFTGPDGYNYISGKYGGIDFHGWYYSIVSSFIPFKFDEFKPTMNTSDTIKLVSANVDYVYKELRLFDDYLEINFTERNWYQGPVQVKPTTKLSLDLGDTRNVCYKICGRMNDCKWKSIVTNKSSPFSTFHFDTREFSNREENGTVSLSLASPVTGRGIELRMNRNNYIDIPLVIATKTGTVHLGFSDDIRHGKNTNHTHRLELRALESVTDIPGFVEPFEDDNELGSIVSSEFFRVDDKKAKFTPNKDAISRRVAIVSNCTNISAFEAFFDPRMIDESFDYFVRLRANVHT